MTEAIDVVIPTWNRRDLLERCLPTVLRQTVPVRVIVVDNGSEDDSVAVVRERFGHAVSVIALPENRGFGAAVNAGVRAGEGALVVLVNNDVECDPGFAEALAAPFADPRVGMAAGLLLRPGRAAIDSYGIEVDATLSGFDRFAGAPWPATAVHARGLAGPSGGAAAYRRAALEEAGPFDEALFAYMEDLDLALRLRAAGWRCAGAPGATGVHLGGATFGRRSRWQVEVGGASRAYLLRKWGVLERGPRVAAWALAMEAGVVLTETAVGRDLAALRGRRAGWRRAAGMRRRIPPAAIDPRLTFRTALRRRAATLRPR